jgi:nitrate reductase gamma subunit
MSGDALLIWARGTGFDLALIVFVAGMLLRLGEILSLGHKPDLSAPRGNGTVGGLRTIFTRTVPQPSIFAKAPLRIINGYLFHIGLFVVIFLYAPHIKFIEAALGIRWPHLPSGLVDAVSAITLLSLVVALVLRLNTPSLRFLSRAEDYWAWLVTVLPVLTGYLAFNHLLFPYTAMLALHILSVELLMVIAPFTKLTHIFSFTLSRWYQGYQAGHRGIES